MKHILPKEAVHTLTTLKKAGFEAYFVGGCVRDTLLGKKPRDWDITTNAIPEQIIPLFPHTFYENKFGTVGIVHDDATDESLKVIEITPYRTESTYSDFRRPDNVTFAKTLAEDLIRRDFTINALAMDEHGNITDLHKGQEDLKNQSIRTVGKPEDRFEEDALRILRAIRIATELGFTIDPETQKALQNKANLLKNISRERIRDEFVKILMSNNPLLGLVLCEKLGILDYISPVLRETIGVEQGGVHAYDVWEHSLRSMQYAADKGWPFEIRLAALFHDIGKPPTRRKGLKKWTFYGHEVVGERITRKVLEDLRFSRETIEKVANLVRWHMFFSDTEQITLSAVRRLIANVGKENVWDLMNLRICDRIGTGRPKEKPYRFRKYQSMIEEAMRDPVTVGMLEIDGNILINELGIPAGPKIGLILHALLEEVLEKPEENSGDNLKKMAKKLALLPENELRMRADMGKMKKNQEEEKEIKKIRSKHSVE